MKIILTNDDGYGEPGLKALYHQVADMDEVIVVAPRHPQSIAGHRVTLKEPILVEQVSAFEYIVAGSPADCTRLALKKIMPDADWVVAGINPGANLGSDVFQSGTVAAAREAAILGRKAIAVSQYIAPQEMIDWQLTGTHVGKILSVVMQKNLTPGQFLNINLPHPLTLETVPEYHWCERDKQPHIFDYERVNNQYRYTGVFHNRPRMEGLDVDVCLSGNVSITLLEV